MCISLAGIAPELVDLRRAVVTNDSDAVRVIVAGDALLAPAVTRRLVEEFAKRTESEQSPAPVIDEITERERGVLTLVGLGLSNTEIPSRLHVSLSTAKTHVGRLLMKFGARDRAQHVIAA
jgi:DNA-binding NarL/FixJ family response regulator